MSKMLINCFTTLCKDSLFFINTVTKKELYLCNPLD